MPETTARRGFAGSLTMGAGQFCTNPGLVFAVEGPGLNDFLNAAKEALGATPAATMLTPGIHNAYREGVTKLAASSCLTEVARGVEGRKGSFLPSGNFCALFAIRTCAALLPEALRDGNPLGLWRRIDGVLGSK
jgi:NADP-dependent aldehyde dehydrogenase